MTQKAKNLESLPKWAQTEIGQLKSAIDDLHRYFGDKVKEMCGNTNTPIEVEFANEKIGCVPVYSRVKFGLKNGTTLEVRFNEDLDGVIIYKCGMMSGHTINVKPVCSNVVEVL